MPGDTPRLYILTDVNCAAERVAQILDRVLSLEYATVTPELQAAQQPESAPMHHPDAGPVLNGFYEQVGPPSFDTDITLIYIRCDETQHIESAMGTSELQAAQQPESVPRHHTDAGPCSMAPMTRQGPHLEAAVGNFSYFALDAMPSTASNGACQG